MTRVEIAASDNAGAILRSGEAFLTRAPAEHNMVLTILNERADHPEPGRYWTVSADGRLAGLALQSPPTVPAILTEIQQDCIEELANAMAADTPNLPGVFGEAATAARFAGCWAERLKIPVVPVEALRLYRLTTLRPPPVAPGSLRTASKADFALVIEWLQGFQHDTEATVAPPDTLRRRLEAGLISIWDDGGPVSMASVTIPLARTVRVGLVYTPPELRGRGYAASCVAALSRAALHAGASQCVLYTQLSNPQSNALYRRLGYEPVIELLRYRFG
jgi:RimJ/RimL family protein N-acetyltransferase